MYIYIYIPNPLYNEVCQDDMGHGSAMAGLARSDLWACRVSGLRVWGLGFRVWGIGFRVRGLGFRAMRENGSYHN